MKRTTRPVAPLPEDPRAVRTLRALFVLAVVILDVSLAGIVFAAVGYGFGGGFVCLALIAPLVVVQPWFVVFAGAIGEPVAAAFATAPFTIAFYFFVRRPGGRLSKFVYRGRYALTAMVGVYALVAVLLFTAAIDFPPRSFSVPVGARAEFRDALHEGRTFVASDFLDNEYFWRARVADADLERVIGGLNLEAADVGALADRFWSSRAYWWSPPRGGQTRYFIEFDRDRAAAWSPDDELLYVWHYSRF